MNVVRQPFLGDAQGHAAFAHYFTQRSQQGIGLGHDAHAFNG